jgi:phosphopantothenoylcysteine decarboxylase/phosphopantothenate--cysteine ligase
MLRGKKILLGVCGSIAAYKSAHLTRLLVKEGAEVQILLTPSALSFITPVTLATLSKKPALHSYVKNDSGEWNNHVELGLWADLMLIAPASANTISKMAAGACDNLLLATYLSARCPVWVAPAMDLDMYAHPSTQQNLNRLTAYGNNIIEAESGELASGLHGQGRLAEPERIVQLLNEFFSPDQPDLSGKKVLITAGPTYEALDPVRFLGNHSSGKMGYALAQEAAQRGAEVTLISGPSSLGKPAGIKLVSVSSAQQMYEACSHIFDEQDMVIFAAAVADYRPRHVADQKIKKAGENLTIELEKTVDIAASLGQRKRPGQVLVGFALETEQEQQHAQEKLRNKNLDYIVLNSLAWPGAGFGHDTNKISVISPKNQLNFELKSKREVAVDILNTISAS